MNVKEYIQVGMACATVQLIALQFDPLFKRHLKKQEGALEKALSCLRTWVICVPLWPVMAVLHLLSFLGACVKRLRKASDRETGRS